jgi:hypothetical protein
MTKILILLMFVLMQSCVSNPSLSKGYSSWYEASLPSTQESLQRIADKEFSNED